MSKQRKPNSKATFPMTFWERQNYRTAVPGEELTVKDTREFEKG